MADVSPDLLGPVRGWRAWTVRPTDDGHRLSSIHYRELWPAGRELRAWCFRSSTLSTAREIRHDRHATPARGCQCGIYAADRLEHAAEYLIPRHTGWETYAAARYVHRIVGEVDLWGRTLECEHGYRAERAYPARLWIPTRRPDGEPVDVSGLALDLVAYGVPVELLEGGARDELLRHLARVSS